MKSSVAVLLIAFAAVMIILSGCSKEIKPAAQNKTNETFMSSIDIWPNQIVPTIPNGTDIQDYILPFRRECTTRVCLAEKKLDYVMAMPSCDGIVNGTGYPYYTWPPGYLFAKTIVLLGINDTQGAYNFYLKYRTLGETDPAAKGFYKKYLDCMSGTSEVINMTCLHDGLCKP